MEKWKKTERLIKLDLPWDCGAPQLAAFPEKLVDVEEPIWKRPEGMTFEDVEELNPGEVGIVAEVASFDGELAELEVGEVVADRGRIATKRIPDIPFPSPEPRMQFRPLQKLSYREFDLIALGCVKDPDEETLLTLLKDPAKKRAGRRG